MKRTEQRKKEALRANKHLVKEKTGVERNLRADLYITAVSTLFCLLLGTTLYFILG